MNSSKENRGFLAVFMLLGVFAVMGIMLTAVCARVYRTSVNDTNRQSSVRVLQSFLRSAVWAENAEGVVSVKDVDGTQAIAFAYPTDSEDYVRLLYCYDGSLRELFVPEDSEYTLRNGEAICPAGDMRVELENGFMRIRVTDDNNVEYEIDLNVL